MSHRKKRTNQRHGRRPRFERCEPRRVLSATTASLDLSATPDAFALFDGLTSRSLVETRALDQVVTNQLGQQPTTIAPFGDFADPVLNVEGANQIVNDALGGASAGITFNHSWQNGAVGQAVGNPFTLAAPQGQGWTLLDADSSIADLGAAGFNPVQVLNSVTPTPLDAAHSIATGGIGITLDTRALPGAVDLLGELPGANYYELAATLPTIRVGALDDFSYANQPPDWEPSDIASVREAWLDLGLSYTVNDQPFGEFFTYADGQLSLPTIELEPNENGTSLIQIVEGAFDFDINPSEILKHVAPRDRFDPSWIVSPDALGESFLEGSETTGDPPEAGDAAAALDIETPLAPILTNPDRPITGRHESGANELLTPRLTAPTVELPAPTVAWGHGWSEPSTDALTEPTEEPRGEPVDGERARPPADPTGRAHADNEPEREASPVPVDATPSAPRIVGRDATPPIERTSFVEAVAPGEGLVDLAALLHEPEGVVVPSRPLVAEAPIQVAARDAALAVESWTRTLPTSAIDVVATGVATGAAASSESVAAPATGRPVSGVSVGGPQRPAAESPGSRPEDRSEPTSEAAEPATAQTSTAQRPLAIATSLIGGLVFLVPRRRRSEAKQPARWAQPRR